MTTEQTYVTNLRILKEAYLEPITAWAKAHPNKLQETDVGAIFFNLTLLYHLNSSMCTAIEEAVDRWAERVSLNRAVFDLIRTKSQKLWKK